MTNATRRTGAPLPRRDFVLLPRLSLLTVLVMLGAAELVSRALFTDHETDVCLAPDARLGLSYSPNCDSTVKSFESPEVANHYNECGYRSETSCGPKPAGTRRVVLLGSSVALGYLVPEPETFAALAAHELTRRCGAPVEFQDLGGYLIFWTRVVNRVDDALRLRPDAAVLEVSSYDLERPDPGEGPASSQDAELPADSLLLRIKEVLGASRAWTVVQHFIYQNDDIYLPMYLRSGNKSDYLREPLNDFWRQRLNHYDAMVGTMSDRFHAAGVPMALVFVPQRAQAGLAAQSRPPAEIHPYLLNRALQAIADKHGISFIDATPRIVRSRRAGSNYYPIDGHLNAQGHGVVASAIVDGLIADLPPFRDCRRSTS